MPEKRERQIAAPPSTDSNAQGIPAAGARNDESAPRRACRAIPGGDFVSLLIEGQIASAARAPSQRRISTQKCLQSYTRRGLRLPADWGADCFSRSRSTLRTQAVL